MGRQASSHQELLATANAFLTAIEPAAVKQLFTDRAFPADLDVQLTAKITALAAAVGRKATGLQGQKQGTVGMKLLRRQVTETMRELRALKVEHLRDTDPDATRGVESGGPRLSRFAKGGGGARERRRHWLG